MDDALYASLCRTIRVIRQEAQATHHTSVPLSEEWESWAKAFVAGLYHRKSAVRAAMAARWEAAHLELEHPAAGALGHAAADLAWAAVYAAAGQDEQAEALAHAVCERCAATSVPAAVAPALDEPTAREADDRTAPGAAGEHEADPATHARLLVERYGSTTAAEMTALYAELMGSGYWRSVSTKVKPRTAL